MLEKYQRSVMKISLNDNGRRSVTLTLFYTAIRSSIELLSEQVPCKCAYCFPRYIPMTGIFYPLIELANAFTEMDCIINVLLGCPYHWYKLEMSKIRYVI